MVLAAVCSKAVVLLLLINFLLLLSLFVEFDVAVRFLSFILDRSASNKVNKFNLYSHFYAKFSRIASTISWLIMADFCILIIGSLSPYHPYHVTLKQKAIIRLFSLLDY